MNVIGRVSVVAFPAVVLALYGCGGNGPYSPIVGGPNADMTLTSTAPQVVAPVGQTAVFPLEVQAVGSFASSVTLACRGLPAGVAGSFSPDATLTPTTAGSAVTLSVPTSGLGAANHSFTVTATGGSLARTLRLTIQATGLTVTVTPQTHDLILGQSVQFTVTVTPQNGHTGGAALAVTGLPDAITAGVTPDTVQLTGTGSQQAALTLSAPAPGARAPSRASGATRMFTVTATSGALAAQADASVTLITTGGIDAVIR
jgi:hypothetical protein